VESVEVEMKRTQEAWRSIMHQFIVLLLLIAPMPILAQVSDAPQVPFRGRVVDATTGAGIENVTIAVPHLRIGSRTNSSGEFTILNVPYRLDDGNLVIEHPCFHGVRIQLRSFFPLEFFEIGLPYRTPRMPDGSPIPSVCSVYGPERR
jgi:hypothetical protein